MYVVHFFLSKLCSLHVRPLLTKRPLSSTDSGPLRSGLPLALGAATGLEKRGNKSKNQFRQFEYSRTTLSACKVEEFFYNILFNFRMLATELEGYLLNFHKEAKLPM